MAHLRKIYFFSAYRKNHNGNNYFMPGREYHRQCFNEWFNYVCSMTDDVIPIWRPHITGRNISAFSACLIALSRYVSGAVGVVVSIAGDLQF